MWARHSWHTSAVQLPGVKAPILTEADANGVVLVDRAACRQRRFEMRMVLLAATAVAGFAVGVTASAAPAQAQAQLMPICMHWKNDIVECRYTSMSQCMATASGIGGDCLPNPAYFQNPEQPSQGRKTRRYDR
jgi:Protein of unknown function (DUF3551)